jgi:hypothetical protein
MYLPLTKDVVGHVRRRAVVQKERLLGPRGR